MPTYNNMDKRNKSFIYHNFQKDDYFNTNFSNSRFDYACFRGAHLKSCVFNDCSFVQTEFMGTNLKDSQFVGAVFDQAVFEGAKLEGVDFKGARFINAIFVETPLEKVRNLNVEDPGIRVFDKMPAIEISVALRERVEKLMFNPFVKRARVLDTKDKKINSISVMLLMERYGEEQLIKRMELLEGRIDRDFYTLSYLIKMMDKME